MLPRVSVVMTNFNKGAYLELAIRSLLGQSLGDFELVLVDDGSTDSSSEIIRGLQETDSRIRLLEHPRNLGPAAARNTGVRETTSTLVTFMDSDDLFSRDRLQRLVDLAANNPTPSPIYSDPVYIDSKATTVSTSPSDSAFRPSGMILSYLLSGAFRFHGGLITAKKICFEEVGKFDETLTWGEDFEMCLRLAASYPITYDGVSTYGYRIYDQNTLNRISKKKRWSVQGQILEKHLRMNMGALDSESVKRSFDYLFSCYVASGQWSKILRYGFTRKEGFESMVGLPIRALRR
ncbi:MAG: glycosyltransferase [Thaumarchaeota archaeon]|nr:glycosyltransferase [Nitrososphaerota archaeon]